MKYQREQCNDSTSQKSHQRDMCEGGKYSCSICGFQTPMKNKLLIHQKSHNGIMYKCNICDKEVSSTNATNGIIMQRKRAVSKDIKNQFIRVSNTIVMNVNTMHPKIVILKHIKNQFMRVLSTDAANVIIRQQ